MRKLLLGFGSKREDGVDAAYETVISWEKLEMFVSLSRRGNREG